MSATDQQFRGRLADPEFRQERARKAIATRHEREALIRQIAEHLAGEPLGAKTVDELRGYLATPAGGAR